VSSTEQLPIEKESGVDFYLVVYASSLAGILLLTILRGFAGATVSGMLQLYFVKYLHVLF